MRCPACAGGFSGRAAESEGNIQGAKQGEGSRLGKGDQCAATTTFPALVQLLGETVFRWNVALGGGSWSWWSPPPVGAATGTGGRGSRGAGLRN